MPKTNIKKRKSRRSEAGLPKPRTVSSSKPCRAPRPGQKCPECGEGRLDYDGLLQLVCPACGYLASGGGFT
ncbi:MAG: hypothetical protein HXY42_06135 [Chloroflexi bacterium]|nr:hypothetical protein [Chloroflexota bacterium]